MMFLFPVSIPESSVAGQTEPAKPFEVPLPKDKFNRMAINVSATIREKRKVVGWFYNK